MFFRKKTTKNSIRFAGKTKDGVYAADKHIELSRVGDTVFTVPKVITENGWINVTVKLDKEGRLLGLQLERWDPGL